MIKLLTLKNLSPYAEDTVYKICLGLDKYELREEPAFDDYRDLFESAVTMLEKGEHIIIVSETTVYNQLKETLMDTLALKKIESAQISVLIDKNAKEEADEKAHSLVPDNCVCHASLDGLFCGFTAEALSGKVTLMPLDFMRIDTIMESFESYLVNGVVEDSHEAVGAEAPDFDFAASVSKMVKSLSEKELRVALATSEATMWIYNLYGEVSGLTDAISFVEVVESENEEPDEENEATSQSESVKLVSRARDAMVNVGAQLGGAVSEIYSTDDEEGNKVYFAYVAIVDKGIAKAKKLSTSNPEDLDLLLPHAVNLLCESVCQRANVLREEAERAAFMAEKEEQEEKTQPKVSKNIIILACVVLFVAVAIPLGLFFHFMNDDEPTTASTNPIVQTQSGESTTASGTTAPTTTDPFAASSTTLPTPSGAVTQPSAPDVSASATTLPAVASTKGLFTFYVFGYGHGVGMSQVGANYLAQQGWTAAEILAHYYYEPNARIVTGEKYPEKITYNGAQYDTREYLASALETEMGSSYSYEALKAQAIAIYTFAKYNNYNLSADAHAFGKTASELCYKVVDDVIAIGYYIAYGEDVAVTPFHAMSAGKTTSYYNVWGKGIGANVPYLVGGRESPGDYLDQNYRSMYTISSDEFKELAKKNLSLELSGDPGSWIAVITHDQAVREDIGYISSISVGGTIITGNEFRIKLMEGRIRSHCFTVVYTPQS